MVPQASKMARAPADLIKSARRAGSDHHPTSGRLLISCTNCSECLVNVIFGRIYPMCKGPELSINLVLNACLS
jgi:hypothetical protein